MIAFVEQPSLRSSSNLPQNRQESLLTRLGMTATIKTSAPASNGSLGVVELTLSPHCRTMLPHWHGQTTEIVYILDGTLAFTVGDESFTGMRGRVVIIPPRTVHHLWNPTASPATVLLLYTPGGLEAYFADLTAMGTATPITAAQWFALAARYDQFPPAVLPEIDRGVKPERKCDCH